MNKQKTKILIVDDEPDILEFLRYNFEKENYDVSTAKNGLKAIEKAKRNSPDLIILDVMMPDLDGIEVCRQLREMPQFASTIIVFLTARNEDYSEIAGFDVGADDYVAKPIRPRALLARIKSLLARKTRDNDSKTMLTFGSLSIDLEKRIVKNNQKTIDLPKKEFQILLMLASNPEKVFLRDEIYTTVWGSDIIVGDRTLDVHIRKLRKNIGKEFIKTSKGTGYSFVFDE